MRLSESEILAGLKHENIFVRDEVLDYFERTRRTQVDITRQLFEVVAQRGWRQAFNWPHKIAAFDLDEPALLWLLPWLERDDWDDARIPLKSHLAGMVRRAPVDILRPHLARILEMPALQVSPVLQMRSCNADRLRQRVAIWDRSPRECWRELRELCREIAGGDTFPHGEVERGEILVERLASAGDEFALEAMHVLAKTDFSPESDLSWLVGFMMKLVAELRLSSAVPLLFRHFATDWDWYNENISRAFVAVGTAPMLTYLRRRYARKRWYVRNYLLAAFESVYTDNVFDCLNRLEQAEDDESLRCNIGVAFASHFDDRGVEPARRLLSETEDNPESQEICERLFAYAHLANIDLPERDAWGERTAASLKRLRDASFGPNSPLTQFLEAAKRFRAAESDAPQKHPASAYTPESLSPTDTIRNDQQAVGRNDPCPCGSGKKYKKCCMRTVSERN